MAAVLSGITPVAGLVGAGEAAAAQAVTTTYLSSLTPTRVSNGLGPLERNRANGGAGANDGGPIVLNGVTHAKGLGVFSTSDVTYPLGGRYKTFATDVGVDDACGSRGSVMVEVHLNGSAAWASRVLRGSSATVTRSFNVTGKTSLRLVTTMAGDGNACDSVDWASARLTRPSSTTTTAPPPTTAPTTTTAPSTTTTAPAPSTTAPPTTPSTTSPPSGATTYLTDLTPASATNGYGPLGFDRSTGNEPITLNGVVYARGLGTHAPSEIRYALGGNYTRFLAAVGIDDECPPPTVGTVAFQAFVDGVKVFDSGIMNVSTATKSVSVDVTGKSELRLVVTDAGDGISCDHGDWAGASLTANGTPPSSSTTVPPTTSSPSTTTSTTTTTQPPAPDVIGGFAEGSWIRQSNDAELARTLDGMVAAGATYVRIDVDWWVVQWEGPATWYWSDIDRLVDAIRGRGMRVLGILDYTPPWARPEGTSGKHPPTNVADYARFAAAAVERYLPRGVRDWEIWNEPNTYWFWEPAPNPAAYTELLKAGYQAIKTIDPGATVITGGLSPAPDAADGSLMKPVTFLQGVYAAGGRGYFDAVGHHPSNWPYMPLRPEPYDYNYNAFGGVTPVLYQTMQANGDGGKKIWATEMGAPTPWQGSTYDYLASYIREAYIAWDNWSFTGPLIWYSYRDGGTDPGDSEQHFGVVQRDFTPKEPGLTAITDMLGG